MNRHLTAAVAVALTLAGAAVAAFRPEAEGALNVRITSPLGRTGVPGTVRIVAQVKADNAVVTHVRFFVDGALLRESEAPPYAAEWVDANPFNASEIKVEAADDHGNTATDKVVLKPLEVTEETHVASVLLETSVQDRAGQFVTGLKAGDFHVQEDSVTQQLDMLREDEVPSTFAVLVDSSQSMSRRVDFVRDAAARLSSYMRPHDRMMVIPFSRHLGAITGPTNDRATVAEAVSAITPHGGTGIMDSLIELAPHLSNIEGRRAVVLITDGYDEHSERNIDDALEAIKDAGATVYVVGIGGVAGISIKGERALKELATATGGRLFLPSREEELPGVHDLIASDVRHRYVLTYTPTNQDIDGKWRQVSVDTTKRSLIVRTRPGYFAAKPPPIRPTIEFTITDPDERFLDVEAADLRVEENGIEQKVDTFQEAVAPVSIVLALDTSGSMRKATAAVQDAARRFVTALRPQDKLALVLFSDTSEFVHDLSTEREWTISGIDRYKATGGTALYDALSDAFIRLRREKSRRAVVVLTDGRDEDNAGKGPGSTRTLDDVLGFVKETDAVVFGIGLGPQVDKSVLGTLAARSGGEAFFPADPADLDAPYQRIIENLRRRWVISYTSTNSARDGKWRPVQITSRFPNAVVRTRGGYYAPGK